MNRILNGQQPSYNMYPSWAAASVLRAHCVCDAPLHCACILSCATRVLWQQTRTNCSSPNLVSTTTTCLKCTGRGVYWCGKGGELWEQLRLTVSPNYGITSLYTCVVVREGLVLLPMHHHTLVCWTIVRRLVDDLKVHIY